jgi:hypothetical protein
MADMEERFTGHLPPQLREAHDKLMGEHRALERKFEALTSVRPRCT